MPVTTTRLCSAIDSEDRLDLPDRTDFTVPRRAEEEAWAKFESLPFALSKEAGAREKEATRDAESTTRRVLSIVEGESRGDSLNTSVRQRPCSADFTASNRTSPPQIPLDT